jgi:stress-induced morphogen
MSGPIEQKIRTKLENAFSPSYLDVINESYKHSVPKGSETHFKVSSKFLGVLILFCECCRNFSRRLKKEKIN